MSINLGNVDLTGLPVGSTGTIKIPNVSLNNPGGTEVSSYLMLFNESGCGLNLDFSDGETAFAPAGSWPRFELHAPPVSQVKWRIDYLLPNPPVSKLIPIFYYPGEPLDSVPTLGNSPIGIGGIVSTAINVLSNEGNSSTTLVIDIGQVGHTLLLTINSDGSCLWSVLQSGVVHNIFAINNAGTPLQIGQTGDFAEFIGKLAVDQNSAFDNGAILTDGLGNVTLSNSKFLKWKDTGGTARNAITLDNANNLQISADSGGGGGAKIYFLDGNGSQIAFMNNLGITLTEGAYGLLVGSMSRISGGVFSCGGGTTISHGLGVTPDLISATPVIAQPGSATVGVGGADPLDAEFTVGSGTQIDVTFIKG